MLLPLLGKEGKVRGLSQLPPTRYLLRLLLDIELLHSGLSQTAILKAQQAWPNGKSKKIRRCHASYPYDIGNGGCNDLQQTIIPFRRTNTSRFNGGR